MGADGYGRSRGGSAIGERRLRGPPLRALRRQRPARHRRRSGRGIRQVWNQHRRSAAKTGISSLRPALHHDAGSVQQFCARSRDRGDRAARFPRRAAALLAYTLPIRGRNESLHMRNFDQLSERELLALAISLEEEDERIYPDFAQELRQNFPDSAKAFEEMREEESGHRRRLQDLYQQKFGDHIPLIRRQDERGFIQRRPVWLARPLRLKAARNEASSIEQETRLFYERAAARTRAASITRLLANLPQDGRPHQSNPNTLNSRERRKRS